MQTVLTEPNSKNDNVSNFEKGRVFEDFIVTLFNRRKFRLLEWRSDKKATNGAYPESCSYPDLEFRYSRGRYQERFAVECKWRKNFFDNKLKWASEKQINTYCDYQSQNAITVYVAIGIGGTPSNPGLLFITPLNHIKMYPTVFRSHLIPYQKNPLQRFEDNRQLQLF